MKPYMKFSMATFLSLVGILAVAEFSAQAQDQDKSFEGGYVGGEVGFLNVDTDISILGNIGGVYYGGFLGVRGQSDNGFVYGIEGYFGGASNDATITVGSASAMIDMGRIFGVDGVLGYAASSKVLVFAHGGYMNAKVTASTSGIAPPVVISDSEGGWRAGGGIEYRFNKNINGRAKLSYGKIEDVGFFSALFGVLVPF